MSPESYEKYMKQWDRWREYIKNGGGGSWPRDAYESVLTEIEHAALDAAAEICNKYCLDEYCHCEIIRQAIQKLKGREGE